MVLKVCLWDWHTWDKGEAWGQWGCRTMQRAKERQRKLTFVSSASCTARGAAILQKEKTDED